MINEQDAALAMRIGDAVKVLNALAEQAADAGLNVRFDVLDFPRTMTQRAGQNKVEVHISKDLRVD